MGITISLHIPMYKLQEDLEVIFNIIDLALEVAMAAENEICVDTTDLLSLYASIYPVATNLIYVHIMHLQWILKFTCFSNPMIQQYIPHSDQGILITIV